MRSYSRLVSITLLAGCFCLHGCGSVKKSLGMERQTPDEFSVTPSMEPLDMPPNFFDLPKPQPGTPRPQDVKVLQQKEAKILGGQAEPMPATNGQQELLEMAGAHERQDDIRTQVDNESRIISAKGKPVLEQLGLRKTSDKQDVVNPVKETQDLQERGISTSSYGTSQ